MDDIDGSSFALDWLSTPEAARYLGLTLPTMYRLVDEGHLKAYRFGRVIRFKKSGLDAYIETSRIRPGTITYLHRMPDELG